MTETTAEARQVVRQQSAVVAGVLLAVIVAVFAVLAIAGGQWDWLLGCVGVIALVVGLLIRPSVELRTDGVTMLNPLRTVHLNWPAIDLVESRWNLRITSVDDQAFTAWAVSNQRARNRRATPSATGSAGGGFATRIAGLRPDPEDIQPVARPASAAAVADRIRSGQEDYRRAVERGLPAQAPEATRRVSPVGAALLIGGPVLFALAFLVG